MKRVLFIILFVIPITLYAQEQTFEQYKMEQQAKYAKYKTQKQKEYDAYRQKINAAYAEFLRQRWGYFEAAPQDTTLPEEPVVPPVIYEKPEPQPQPAPVPQPQPTPRQNPLQEPAPKPNPIPLPLPTPQPIKIDKDSLTIPTPAPELEPQPEPQPLPAPRPIKIDKDILTIPTPAPQPKPIVPILPQENQKFKNENVVFYGTSVTLGFPNPDNFKMNEVSEQEISTAWEFLMEESYNITVSTALATRNQLALCDWAYMEMLQQVCEKHYGKSTNEAMMMMAYVLIQSGYKLRFAHSDGRLYILINSDYIIYNSSCYILGDDFFYPINCDKRSLYICDASFEAEKSFCLQIAKEQAFAYKATPMRTLKSVKGITAEVCVNKNSIDFYNNYPSACINGDFSTKWAAYANSPLEQKIKETLYPQLKKAIARLSEFEQVNKILNFVQTAFVYEYDDKVWGHDRAFFSTETLYYPYCDCEDRSILFSRLIRDLLGLDVVLLYYPGHLATAVNFKTDVRGDYLMVNGEKYIVCDPTYIGAPVGNTMPNMDNKIAKVIMLDK